MILLSVPLPKPLCDAHSGGSRLAGLWLFRIVGRRLFTESSLQNYGVAEALRTLLAQPTQRGRTATDRGGERVRARIKSKKWPQAADH